MQYTGLKMEKLCKSLLYSWKALQPVNFSRILFSNICGGKCVTMHQHSRIKMTPRHGHAFHITGPLWWESTDHWLIPLANNQWYRAFYFQQEQAVEQTVFSAEITDTWILIWLHCNVIWNRFLLQINRLLVNVVVGGIILLIANTLRGEQYRIL